MFRKRFIVFAILVIVSSNCSAALLTAPIQNPSNNHFYYLLTSNTWTASQVEAVTLGGSLVTINDATENQWVLDTFGNLNGTARHLWIGFNDVASEGTFVWANGEPVVFTNWTSGEPNNRPNSAAGTSDEDYAFMWRPGTTGFGRFPGGWNDYANLTTVVGDPAAGAIYEVVEAPSIIPIPAAVWLFGFALAGFSIFGRHRSH